MHIWTFLLASILAVVSSTHGKPDYVVEVVFLIEPQVVKNYRHLGYSESSAKTAIKNDANFVINQINEFYKTSFSGNLEIRAKALDIMDEEMFIPCKIISPNLLQADLALAVMKNWLKDNDSKYGQYDMAVVWTGFDVMGEGGAHSVAGYAPLKEVCSKEYRNIALAEFRGTQQSATVTAHEIGHNLGSKHDETRDCYDGYIMTPVDEPMAKNRWSFSSCSVQSILSNLKSLDSQGKNCLKNPTTPPSNYDINNQMDILKPEKICQRSVNNSDSYFCSSLVRNEDHMCKTIFCAQIGSMSCSSATPSDGMACGVNKRCYQGKCLQDEKLSTPANVKDGCVFGDLKYFEVGGKGTDCPTLLKEDRNNCYTYKSYCCESCSKVTTGTKDCPFGDKNVRFNGGGTCASVVKSNPTNCYQENVKSLCCESCSKAETGIEGCEYGSKSSQCARYKDDLDWLCSTNKEMCCLECSGFKGKRSPPDNDFIGAIMAAEKPQINVATIVEDDASDEEVDQA